MSNSRIDVSQVVIIVLNYCGVSDTIHCLKSLYKLDCKPLSIIVVDNNSPDDSASIIQQAWPEATSVTEETALSLQQLPDALFFQLKVNNGYASGNNAAIKLALVDTRCKAVWILNNDTEVSSASLSALCERMSANPKIGIVGATILSMYDRDKVFCVAGGSIFPPLGITKACHGDIHLHEADKLQPECVEQELDDIIGCSMLIRNEVFSIAGLFDENYFLYGEETEFCIRVKKAGFIFSWAPGAMVWHKEGASTGAQTALGSKKFSRPKWVEYLSLRNRAYTIKKHYPYYIVTLAFSYILVALRRVLRGQSDRIGLVFHALVDGIVEKMGKPKFFGIPS